VAKRVLRPYGYMIIGMIDRESPPGKVYESRKNTSRLILQTCHPEPFVSLKGKFRKGSLYEILHFE
jgi:hypothetical protein